VDEQNVIFAHPMATGMPNARPLLRSLGSCFHVVPGYIRIWVELSGLLNRQTGLECGFGCVSLDNSRLQIMRPTGNLHQAALRVGEKAVVRSLGIGLQIALIVFERFLGSSALAR
jgi:hypothetical protein